MAQTKLSVLDGAEMVAVEERGFSELLVAWYGGTQFRVFTQTGKSDYPLDERTVFSLSDENGEPVSREEAEKQARVWLQDTLEEQR